MYIDPYWAGVATTIIAEIVVIFIAACVSVAKSKKNGGK